MKPDDVIKLRERELAEAATAREREYSRLYDLGNIPKSMRTVSLGAINNSDHKPKIIAWMDRVRTATKENKPEHGLYMYGPYGSGKTSLAAGLAMWATRHKIYSHYIKYSELFATKKENPQWHEESDIGVWDRLLKVPLLVVDDLFRHNQENFGRINVLALEQLIEARMEDRSLLNIFTANDSIDSLEKTEAERLAGLIMQSCYILQISGVDFRKMMQQNRKAL